MEQLKKVRSIAKGNVTRKANKVNEILASCDNADSVQESAKELDEVLKQFEAAHDTKLNSTEMIVLLGEHVRMN